MTEEKGLSVSCACQVGSRPVVRRPRQPDRSRQSSRDTHRRTSGNPLRSIDYNRGLSVVAKGGNDYFLESERLTSVL